MNTHPALALIDVPTIAGDLINAQFVFLYNLPGFKIEPKTLATTLQGSKASIEKTCKVELNWGCYEVPRMFYVAYSSAWDMIIVKPALQVVRGPISAGTAPVTIEPTGMDEFSLRMWKGYGVTDQKPDLSTAWNSILARADKLAVRAA